MHNKSNKKSVRPHSHRSQLEVMHLKFQIFWQRGMYCLLSENKHVTLIYNFAYDKWAASWENQQSAKAKTKMQISFAVAAKLISAFVFAIRIVQFLFYVKPKFQASSFFLCLYRPVCFGPVRKPHCWFSHKAAQILLYSGPKVCTSQLYGIRTIVGILPAWFRFAQCLRRYRDTKLVFPHVVNAGKYSTSFFTALFSTLYNVQKGKAVD